MSDTGTPRLWPDAAQPTAGQLAAWLIACSDAERVALCARMLDAQERASRCFALDHEQRLAQRASLRQALHDIDSPNCSCDGGDIYGAMADRIAYLLNNNPGRFYEALTDLEQETRDA